MHQTKAPRALMTPDEIMNQPNSMATVFMPGVLEKPVQVQLRNYWQRRDLAGRYLSDPFHSKDGTVELRGLLGQRHKQIITEPVPGKYAHYPQYASGMWSYVQGYRP